MIDEGFEIPTRWEPSGDEPSASALELLQELQESDALLLADDAACERALDLAGSFLRLAPRARTELVDALTSNLHWLASSVSALLEDFDSTDPAAVLAHRSAVKATAFLLHCVWTQSDDEARSGGGTSTMAIAAAVSGKGGRGGAKKPAAAKSRRAAADDDDSDGGGGGGGMAGGAWDWDGWGRPAVLGALAAAMGADLRALYGSLAGTERLAGLALEMAAASLESKSVSGKTNAAARDDAFDVIALASVRYGAAEAAAATLIKAARADGVAALVAGAAARAEERYNSTQLAVALLAEFARASPAELDSEHKANARQVTALAALLPALAAACPAATANQASLLRPYLACASQTLRGGVLTAAGVLLEKVYYPGAISGATAAGAVAAHSRSKTALLDLLRSRVLDKGAIARARALQVWTALVKQACVPLSWLNVVAGLAAGRLEDESQSVARAAMLLLHTLVTCSPFGALDAAKLGATLSHLEARLAALGPEPRAAGDDDDEGGDKEGEGDGEGGARWADGGVDAAAAAAADGQDAAAASGNGGDRSSNDQRAAAAAGAGDLGLDDPDKGTLPGDTERSQLRHLIATVKEGLALSRLLTGALPALRRLLASPSGDAVQDATKLIAVFRHFEVPGAAAALRGTWPLVFAREEGVRAAALEAWGAIYLGGRTHKEQAAILLEEALPSATLGELTALEAILTALASDPSAPLNPGALMKAALGEAFRGAAQRAAAVAAAAKAGNGGGDATAGGRRSSAMDTDDAGDQAGDAGGPAEQGVVDEAAAAAAMQRACRLALQLMALLAKAAPAAALPHVGALARFGLAPGRDAAAARAACQVLTAAAPSLLTPAGARELAAAAGEADPEAARASFLRGAYEGLAALLVAAPARAAGDGYGGGDGPIDDADGDSDPDANWPSVAEAAVAAIYALHPRPGALVGAVFKRLADASGLLDDACAPSAAGAARFCAVLGAAALQHLAHAERLARAARSARTAAGRAAAQAASDAAHGGAAATGKATKGKGGGKGGKGGAAADEEDDIAAQIGVGAGATVDEIDAIATDVEMQMLAPGSMFGAYADLLSAFCARRAFLSSPPALQAAALLCLSRLMAGGGRLCAPATAGGRDNVALLFTLLLERKAPPHVRVNLVVALADLASRWPNALEPWTWAMYEPLADPSTAVRSAALTALTHLVLGGRLKAKGAVARVARLMVDADEGIAARARLFFSQLARSGTGGARAAASASAAAAGASAANPVYNLLPELLSALCRDEDLDDASFRLVMAELLPYVKDRQADALRERLALRMEHAPGGPREWRWLAFCLGALGYTERAARRLMELTGKYKHALAEDDVYDVFRGFAEKAVKAGGGGGAPKPKAGGLATVAEEEAGAADAADGGADESQAAAAAAGSESQGGAAPAASAGVSVTGDGLREKAEEWLRALDAAREAALEARSVEEAAAAKARRRASAAAAAEEEGGFSAPAAADAEPTAAAVPAVDADDGAEMAATAAAGDESADAAAAAAAAAPTSAPTPPAGADAAEAEAAPSGGDADGEDGEIALLHSQLGEELEAAAAGRARLSGVSGVSSATAEDGDSVSDVGAQLAALSVAGGARSRGAARSKAASRGCGGGSTRARGGGTRATRAAAAAAESGSGSDGDDGADDMEDEGVEVPAASNTRAASSRAAAAPARRRAAAVPAAPAPAAAAGGTRRTRRAVISDDDEA